MRVGNLLCCSFRPSYSQLVIIHMPHAPLISPNPMSSVVTPSAATSSSPFVPPQYVQDFPSPFLAPQCVQPPLARPRNGVSPPSLLKYEIYQFFAYLLPSFDATKRAPQLHSSVSLHCPFSFLAAPRSLSVASRPVLTARVYIHVHVSLLATSPSFPTHVSCKPFPAPVLLPALQALLLRSSPFAYRRLLPSS